MTALLAVYAIGLVLWLAFVKITVRDPRPSDRLLYAALWPLVVMYAIKQALAGHARVTRSSSISTEPRPVVRAAGFCGQHSAYEVCRDCEVPS